MADLEPRPGQVLVGPRGGARMVDRVEGGRVRWWGASRVGGAWFAFGDARWTDREAWDRWAAKARVVREGR